jgi:hypothetical protein
MLVTPFGLFPIKTNLELLIIVDSWQDSLDGWSANRKASTYTGQQEHRLKRTHIRASSGIRTHNSSFWAGEVISCLWLGAALWCASYVSNNLCFQLISEILEFRFQFWLIISITCVCRIGSLDISSSVMVITWMHATWQSWMKLIFDIWK